MAGKKEVIRKREGGGRGDKKPFFSFGLFPPLADPPKEKNGAKRNSGRPAREKRLDAFKFLRCEKPAIIVRDLNISFKVSSRRKRTRFTFIRENFLPFSFRMDELRVLKNVSFDVRSGECVGIIGENGSGKSTLLRVIARIFKPDSGSVITKGKISPFLELGVGFQGELSARENIFIFGELMGIRKKDMNLLFDEIITFAGLRQFTEVKIKNFSSGMYARLAFTCAVAVEPDILLIDEIFAVGDEAFRHKCIQKLQEFKKAGRTILLVSHRLGDIRTLCDRLILLSRGEIAAIGHPDDVISHYLDSFVSSDYQIGSVVNDIDKVIVNEFPGNDMGSMKGKERGTIIKEVSVSHPGIKTGNTLEIDVEIGSRKLIKDPHFIVQILKKGDVMVFGTNTARDKVSIGNIDGKGRIKLTFPKIELLGGDYYINIELWGGKLTECLEKHERCASFSVVSRSKDGTGIVKMEHRWETDF